MRIAYLACFSLFLAGCCCGSKPSGGSPSTTSPGVPEPAEVPEAPAITVDAKKLYTDYEANEVAADEVYKGKVLMVSGTVKSIDKDFLDNIVLLLEAGDKYGMNSIRATTKDSEKSKAARLAKGTKVSLVCVGNGAVIHSPSLKDCVIQ